MRIKKRAFTLMELLMATGILAFALTGLLLLFLNCVFLNEASRNLMIATSHGQHALEEVVRRQYANFSTLSGTLETWRQAQLVSEGLTPLENETVVITVGSGTEPLNLNVAVNWTERNTRNRSISFDSLLTEP